MPLADLGCKYVSGDSLGSGLLREAERRSGMTCAAWLRSAQRLLATRVSVLPSCPLVTSFIAQECCIAFQMAFQVVS